MRVLRFVARSVDAFTLPIESTTQSNEPGIAQETVRLHSSSAATSRRVVPGGRVTVPS